MYGFHLVFVNGVIAQGATLPWTRGVFIVREVLQHARPAIYVPALCNARGQHLGKGFHTYWALYICCINHVEDNLLDIFPLYVLIWIIEVECVVIIVVICWSWMISHDKFECWLHTIVLHGTVILFRPTSFSLPPTFLCSIRVVILPFFLIIVVRETKKEVGLWCCWASLWDLFFHDLEVIIMEIWRVLIVIIAARLSEFEGRLALGNPGVLNLHAMRFCQLLLLQGFPTLSLQFFLLHENFVWLSLFLPLLLLRLFLLARLRIVWGKMSTARRLLLEHLLLLIWDKWWRT